VNVAPRWPMLALALGSLAIVTACGSAASEPLRTTITVTTTASPAPPPATAGNEYPVTEPGPAQSTDDALTYTQAPPPPGSNTDNPASDYEAALASRKAEEARQRACNQAIVVRGQLSKLEEAQRDIDLNRDVWEDMERTRQLQEAQNQLESTLRVLQEQCRS
jgi:hypothetical protein